MAGGIGAANVNQRDLTQAQLNLNDASGRVIDDIKALTEQVARTNDAKELQLLQLKIQERQRALEAIKAAEEKLAKAAELVNKFVQAQ